MKKFKINAFQKGLVFKNRNILRILEEGTHWLWTSEFVQVFEMNQPLKIDNMLNIYLDTPVFMEAVERKEVKNGELLLVEESGVLRHVLTAGNYFFWKSSIARTFRLVDLAETEVSENIGKHEILNPLLTPFLQVCKVETGEKGLLLLGNKFIKQLDTGTYFFWKSALTLNVIRVEMRTQNMEVSGQEMLTKDKAAVRMNFNLMFKIVNAEKWALENKEAEKQLYALTQLALREYVGQYTLDELLEKKESIGAFIERALAEVLIGLGAELISSGIKDIILPGEMKEILNQVLIAEKRAQANSIMRREETASTRSLLNTAKMMEENTMLFKLKEMEFVEKIAEKVNSISVSGNGQMLTQLKQLFSSGNNA